MTQPIVVTIGEILADFVPAGVGTYVLRPGGAVSNVAVNLSRLGVACGIISRVGADLLGAYLLERLRQNGVDVRCVRCVRGPRTGLVLVSLGEDGERDFTFYGDPSADQFLRPADVRERELRAVKILHFGSIGMRRRPSREATLKAFRIVRRHGGLISYDCNVRLNLWEGRHDAARRQIRRWFHHADIVKLSLEELDFLYGARVGRQSLQRLFTDHQLVLLSAGRDGCYIKLGEMLEHAPGTRVRAVDTTGAGDAFMAGALYQILALGRRLNLDRAALLTIARLANHCGASAVTRRGAV